MNIDFLAEGNTGGQTLLRLVSRGNAILAELLRLSRNIPPIFKQSFEGKENREYLLKYGDIMFDFKYLKSSELLEEKIEKSPQLQDIDYEFREAHIDILKRFYMLFEGIYKYVTDFIRFVDDLEEGVFIQLTLETVLLNPEGKQLMAESIYLYGVMLTLTEELIEGTVRERLLISFLRYKGQTETPLLDSVFQLWSRTGYVPGQKKPPKYPENFFQRIKLPRKVVNMVVGRLRSDDIYNQVSAYPQPEHRSTALSTQACMLYIILYFAPDILENEQSIMREIVDKHFADNWIISYYLGYLVDLSQVWSVYTAARLALSNTLQIPTITTLSNRYRGAVPKLTAKLDQYLTEGVLNYSYILEKNHILMNFCRECNVTIRWLLLHTRTANKKLQELILRDYDANSVLLLILKTAQFEFLMKKIYQQLLDTKEEKWNHCKKEGSERMKELGEYFSGEKALTRVKRNESLLKWFLSISEKVSMLDFHDSTLAGRKIQQLMQALEEVEQFHQIETDLQVRQFLSDTRTYLAQMIRIVNIKLEFLGILALVSDMSYAFQLIRTFIPSMQQQIKISPISVIMLRSTFLKLSSILDLPLVRINMAKSPDFISVSEYFSSELVKFVRRVLSIVPESMFAILNEIIQLQTHEMIELPTKIEKEKFRDFAQLELRHKLAKATHSVSVFTEGILAMENTFVGVIEVNPKKLLEDGIRKELVKKIAGSMDSILVMKTGRPEELSARLNQLSSQLDGFRRSFQYIQDYVNIYGLKIWQEEFSRIVNYNVEQECNSFLKKKIYDHQSIYQSETIRIPSFPRVDESVNFIGRLGREILRQTDYRSTTYLDQMSSWYDETGKELIGIRTFTLLINSVGVFGVTGLDRFYSFMIVKELQDFVNLCKSQMKAAAKTFAAISTQLHPTSIIPSHADKLYTEAVAVTTKFTSSFMAIMCKIGQMQLIRRQIASLLNFTCKIDSKAFYHSLDAINLAILNDVKAHYLNPETFPYPDDDDNPLLVELTEYLDTAGINNALTKIYITSSPINHFPLLMFLFALSQVSKFKYDRHLSILTSVLPRRKGGVDSTPFVVGFITVLKQFHSIHTQKLMAYFGQHIRSYLNDTNRNQKVPLTDYPPEAISVLLFLESFCKYASSIDRKNLEVYLPPYAFDHFTH